VRLAIEDELNGNVTAEEGRVVRIPSWGHLKIPVLRSVPFEIDRSSGRRPRKGTRKVRTKHRRTKGPTGGQDSPTATATYFTRFAFLVLSFLVTPIIAGPQWLPVPRVSGGMRHGNTLTFPDPCRTEPQVPAACRVARTRGDKKVLARATLLETETWSGARGINPRRNF